MAALGDSWQKLEAEVVDCRRCPRLVQWREQVAREKRRAYLDWDYWGKPVPGFGDPEARLLIIGLAPAAHGANRTGRMFSGDSSGRTLIPALYRAGFANQELSNAPGDGLRLIDAYLTAVVRCAPPKNRPSAEEEGNCRSYLARELALLKDVQVVLALGKIAFDGYLRHLGEQSGLARRPAFGHGAYFAGDDARPHLLASYHPSRQNTNTGRLTEAMLDEVLAAARSCLHEPQS